MPAAPAPAPPARGCRRRRRRRPHAGLTPRGVYALLCAGLALGTIGCSLARRGQQALGPLLQPLPSAPRPLEHPLVDALAQRLLEARRQARHLHAGQSPDHRRLLSPIAAAGTEWEASSLTWALLRQTGALLPMAWPDIPHSPEALQGWLRRELALGRRPSTELWLVQARDGSPAEAELVIVWVDDIWRSGTEALDVPVAERRSWVLTARETPPIASSDESFNAGCCGVVHLREQGGRVGLESRDALYELQRKGGVIHAYQEHPWDEWDMSWLERHAERIRAPQPTVALLSGDARLELRLSEPAPHAPQRWEWGVARGTMAAPLPLVRTSEACVTGIVAAPRAWGEHDAWLVVEQDANLDLRIALYSAPLRALSGTPMWDVHPDTHAIRQSIPARPITVAPVTPAGLRGAALEDPWVAWRLVHCGVQLYVAGAPRTAVPAPLRPREQPSDGGRSWEVRLPQLRARGALPAINAADWARALRAAIAEPRAAEGRRPQDDWLLGPLLGAQVEATREGVRLTFRQPVRDLQDRLAHPRLALQDSVIASRFASHRFAGPRQLDRLLPRHAGLTPLELIPTRDPAQARARYLRGESALLRPFELALDDPLARAGAAAALAAPGRAGETPDGNAMGEQPLCVAVIVDPEAPPALRRALAWRLRGFTPHDLLAVEDSTLRPRLPGSAIERSNLAPPDGAFSPAPEALRGVVLELSVDVLPEAQRAAERLAVLLQGDGVRTLLVDRAAATGPTGASQEGAASAGRAQRLRARLTRIPLFSAEHLLRALELRARVLPGQELPDDLRKAAQLDPNEQTRIDAAARAELELLTEGLVVPLWTQPGVVLFDGRLGDAGALGRYQEAMTSLPLTMHEARWYPLPPPR